MQRERIYSIIHTQDKQNRQTDNKCLRQFMRSPQKAKVDYNTFMLGQKKHPKVQQSRVETSLNQTTIGSYKYESRVRPESSYMCEFLAKQNQYLINQLMIQKDKERAYKRKINQLKRAKSQQSIAPHQFSKYISINDKQYQKRSQYEDRISEMNQTSSVVTMKTFEDEHDTLETLLNNSQQYIKHTRQSLSNQLQILGDKLCRLLHQTSAEPSFEVKQKKRKQMFQCVEQLRELKEQYVRHFPNE